MISPTLVAIVFGSQLAMTVADDVPAFDVTPGCRAAAAVSDGERRAQPPAGQGGWRRQVATRSVGAAALACRDERHARFKTGNGPDESPDTRPTLIPLGRNPPTPGPVWT